MKGGFKLEEYSWSFIWLTQCLASLVKTSSRRMKTQYRVIYVIHGIIVNAAILTFLIEKTVQIGTELWYSFFCKQYNISFGKIEHASVQQIFTTRELLEAQ